MDDVRRLMWAARKADKNLHQSVSLTVQRYHISKNDCPTLSDSKRNIYLFNIFPINPNPFFVRRGFNLYPKPLSLSREGA